MVDETKKSCVVVLGMHRSGTSGLTGALTELGFQGPKVPVKPDRFNPTGYWEPESVVSLNIALLSDIGSSTDDWRTLRIDWDGEIAGRWTSLIRDCLSRDFEGAQRICLKDPRICRLFPLYKRALEELGFEVTALHIYRHPDAVAASLFARDGSSKTFGTLLWARHVLDAERYSREVRRRFIAYDELLADPSKAIASLNVLELQPFSRPVTSLKASLRHHETDSTEDQSQTGHLVSEIFTSLNLLRADPESRSAQEKLDQVESKISAAESILARPLHDELRARSANISASRDYFASLALRRELEIERLGSIIRGETVHIDDAPQTQVRTEAEATELEEVQQDYIHVARELAAIKRSSAYRIAQKLERHITNPYLRRLASSLAATPTHVTPFDLSELTRNRLLSTGLFDEDYYRDRYSKKLSNDDDLLRDFLESPVEECRDPSSVFSTRHYYSLNPDVKDAGMNALYHYALWGIAEGRPAFSQYRVGRFLNSVSFENVVPIGHVVPPSEKVVVMCSEAGNFFFRDIALSVARLLQLKGYVVETNFSSNYPETGTPLVVAPHEFFLDGRWTAAQRKSAIMLNTEQWQTPWFSKALFYMMSSNQGVLDMNPNSAAGLAALGLRASFFPLLPCPGSPFSAERRPLSPALRSAKYTPILTYPNDVSDRPIDVLFVGVLNERRNGILAELSETLSEFKSFIHSPRYTGPITDHDPDKLGTDDLYQLALNAKILLNVHRDEVGYFEWHRLFLFGVASGCAVLTEPCLANPFLRSGVNYIECHHSTLGSKLRWLLSDPQGRGVLSNISKANNNLMVRINAGEQVI